MRGFTDWRHEKYHTHDSIRLVACQVTDHGLVTLSNADTKKVALSCTDTKGLLNTFVEAL